MKVLSLEWRGEEVRVVSEDGVLEILAETALAKGLREGTELEDLEGLLHEDQVRRAKKIAFRYLARARTTKQVRERLLEEGFGEDVVGEVVGRLEELGLLDDREFARAWVEERLRLRPRWRRALKEELLRKGISEEVAEEALDEELSEVDEARLAEGLLRRAEGRYRNLEPDKALRRMRDFLLRRGFSWEAVKEVTRKLRKEWFSDEVGRDKGEVPEVL
ncbi:MAG: hypothetical protein DRP94_06565 [Candidatus Latescibacterota bacterium]|nr:MAG: hypothetical protein DRP94_06565 [Candidatus Latescibacterota bacterium]